MTVSLLLHDIIGRAIVEHKTHVVLSQGTRQDEVRKAIRIFMRRHPEIFWFSHQYRFDSPTSTLYLSYNFNIEKTNFYRKEIDNAVRFLFKPDKLTGMSDIEKVTYVYKWLAENTTYNEYSSFNQTIYSVLINRNSVCTGYAKTAQYLLGLLGVESELVFGKFHSDKSREGRHGWNIVKIDGDWYHVDFCIADPSLKRLLNPDETPLEFDGLLWNYFCKPTEYILKNRSIEFIESLPKCEKSIDNWPNISLAKPMRQLAVCKSDSGTSAKIYLDSFNKNRVIKVARTENSLIDNEYELLKRLEGCKHIINAVGINENGLELEQLTPWSELLNSHYYQPDEYELTKILFQLTEGLIECRGHGVTYSDIHYNNVFVTKEGIYKWGDFGIAFPSWSDGLMPPNLIGPDGVALGSRWFMAPETFKDNRFTESSAVYSLAMMAYFVLNDMRPPYWDEKMSHEEILEMLHSPDRNIPVPKAGESKFWRFLRKFCLCFDERYRVSSLDDFQEAFKTFFFSYNPYQIASRLTLQDLADSSDTDSFALTDMCMAKWEPTPPAPPSAYNTYDTDTFARTSGMGPTSAPPAPANISEPNYCAPSGSSQTTPDSEVTYHPVNRNEGNQTDSSSKSKSRFGGALLNPILKGIRGFFFGSSNNEPEQKTTQDINACLYAPKEIQPYKSFIIRVYMYLPDEQKEVDSKIKNIDPTAERKEYKPLDLPVKEGDKLTVQLQLTEGVLCMNPIKTTIWRNRYTDCSFTAKLTEENVANIDGVAYVSVNDVPAGEMLFTIDVVETQPREIYTKIDSRRFSKIFISYAHQDEMQVRGIAEGCKMLGRDYFFDRHTLQAGDLFKDKILSYIDDADLFVLCWSKNAAESEWVKIEREHALNLISEGKSTLAIYPLSLQPEAPLPVDMSDKYNFGKL